MERPEEASVAEGLARLHKAGSVLLIVATSEEAERQRKTLADRGVNTTMTKTMINENKGGTVLIQTIREVSEAAEPEFIQTASSYRYLTFSPSVEDCQAMTGECLNGALTAMFGRVGATMVRVHGGAIHTNGGPCRAFDAGRLSALLGSGAEQVRITYLRNLHARLRARRWQQ